MNESKGGRLDGATQRCQYKGVVGYYECINREKVYNPESTRHFLKSFLLVILSLWAIRYGARLLRFFREKLYCIMSWIGRLLYVVYS